VRQSKRRSDKDTFALETGRSARSPKSLTLPLQASKDAQKKDSKHKERLSEADAEKVRDGSRFASCLAPASSKGRTAQKAQRRVEEDLVKDMQNFSRKYDSETHTATTSKATAPVSSRPNVYSIKLPLKGEVHNKLCESTRSEASSTAKFSVQTLRNFFRTLDSDGSGSISKREMIVALRANKNLQSLFLNHKQAPQTQIATQRQMEDQRV